MTKSQRAVVTRAAVRWLAAEDASAALARVRATDTTTPAHVVDALGVVNLWLRAVRGDEMGAMLTALGGFDGPVDALLQQWQRHVDESAGLMTHPAHDVVATLAKEPT